MRSGSVLFLLGAGASVDSGMKTYRGTGDAYYTFDETDPLANPLHVCALGDDSGMERMWDHLMPIVKDARQVDQLGPTYANIAELAATYESSMVITQNIDSLALRMPGIDNVVELHGSLAYTRCLRCGVRNAFVDGVFRCPGTCQGWLRPDVVLFGENVSTRNGDRVRSYIKRARPVDCYVVGTSLRFPYLHNIIKCAKARGASVTHVNPDPAYVWHLQRQQNVYNTMTGEFRVRMVRKKKPDRLIKWFI